MTTPATDLPVTRYSRVVDRLLAVIGSWLSLAWWLLLGVIVLNVVFRYLFNQGRIEFEELQWHIYATGFLLGLSVAYSQDAHIRVDVLRERFSVSTRAWIELYGTLLLLLPFVILVLYSALDFVRYSFATAETSEAPGGLALRWLIKFTLPLGFTLLLLALTARLSRVLAQLFGVPGAIESAVHGDNT